MGISAGIGLYSEIQCQVTFKFINLAAIKNSHLNTTTL
jgi:hypothetical protein